MPDKAMTGPGEIQGIYQPTPGGIVLTESTRSGLYNPVIGLVNGSGSAVLAGSCIKLSTTATKTFLTSTTVDDPDIVGVTLDDIPNGAEGRCQLYTGYIKQVRVAAGTVKGQYLQQSATAGVGQGTTDQTQGTFAQAIVDRDGNGNVEAILMLRAPTPGVTSGGSTDITYLLYIFGRRG